MIEDKTKPARPTHRDWAVFRYGLISEATRPLTDEVASQVLARVAARQHQLPDGSIRRFSVSTLRLWLRKYQRGGLDALLPRTRSDKGSFRSLDDIAKLRRSVEAGLNPRDAKFELGKEIVARFHGDAAAEAARQEFIARFQQGAMPDEIPEQTLSSKDGKLGLAHLLRDAGLVGSTSEAFRMIKQRAVRIDGDQVEDRSLEIEAGSTHIYQVGKRKFARVTLT